MNLAACLWQFRYLKSQLQREELRRVTALPELRTKEALGALITAAFVNQAWDTHRQTYLYSLLPLTTDFVQKRIAEDRNLEASLRDSYSDYLVSKGQYEAALGQLAGLLPEGDLPEKERISNMLVEAGYRAYQSGSYQEAVARFEHAESYKETGYLYHTWGVVERDEGAYGNAQAKFRKATSLDASRIATWRSWGRMEHRLGNYEKAVECYTQATSLPSSDAQDHHNLGVCLSRLSPRRKGSEQLDLLQRASQDLSDGFYTNPVGYRENHHNVVNSHALALNSFRLGKNELAIEQCEYGLSIEPHNERLVDLIRNIINQSRS